MQNTYTKQVCGIQIQCNVVQMGNDYTISIWDNTAGHIGCAVLSLARPSLTETGISVTSSVLNRTGHKDDIIALKFAEAVAKKSGTCAVCTCGIHMDNITAEQIQEILAACDELLQSVIST